MQRILKEFLESELPNRSLACAHCLQMSWVCSDEPQNVQMVEEDDNLNCSLVQINRKNKNKHHCAKFVAQPVQGESGGTQIANAM